MNAKVISDSTLPAVTPDDDDLMLIYDTSEGTTGKATIADIAPKVAENIDIATLPAVTPDDDDVLMLRDTSAETTGKATIADIAPKVAENIDISTLPAVTPAADDVLMIRDTSAETTGKATISDIIQKGVLVEDFLLYTPLIQREKNKGDSEGGEIRFQNANNSTIGNVVMDVFNNTVRFFTTINGVLKMFTLDFENKTAYWN